MTQRLTMASVLLALLSVSVTVRGQTTEGGEEESLRRKSPLSWTQLEKRQEEARERGQEAAKEWDAGIQRRVDEAVRKTQPTTGPDHPGYVTVGDKRIDVPHPKTLEDVTGKPQVHDIWERSPKDFDFIIHDIFELGLEDVRLMAEPQQIVVQRPQRIVGDPPTVIGPTDAKFLVPFSITNSTARQRRLGLRVWIATDDMVFHPVVGGWVHRRKLEKSMLRFLTGAQQVKWQDALNLIGYVREEDGRKEPQNVFTPGETKYGVAVFPIWDREMDSMKIIFEGVSNAFKYDKRMKRVMVFNYEHRGDEFFPQEEGIEFKGKDWEWMWMWWSDIAIDTDTPPVRMPFTSPSGQTRYYWYTRYTLTNSTDEPQEIELTSFNRIVPVTLDVAGRTLSNVPVEIVDDGKSTMDKARIIEDVVGRWDKDRHTDRLFKGTINPKSELDPGRKDGLLIWGEHDIDWDKLYQEITYRINAPSGDREWDQKLPGIDYIKRLEETEKLEQALPQAEDLSRRFLTLGDDAKASIRQQVVDQMQERLQQALDRNEIIANVTAKAGLVSGTFYIKRFYNKPGKIEQQWLPDWDKELERLQDKL